MNYHSYVYSVNITYDTARNERNIALRGLSFDLAADLDWADASIVEDTRNLMASPGSSHTAISVTGCMCLFTHLAQAASA